VLYSNLETATPFGGAITQNGNNGTKAGCAVGAAGTPCYTATDIDNWAVRLRVNRNFYP
jgi:hypothetical protein